MGHGYAEMFPNGENWRDFSSRYAKYQQACAKEISDIIEKNPIKFENIQIGDILNLYAPLHGTSRIRLDNKREFHKIRELFSSSAHYYPMNMWPLANRNFFRGL